MKKKPNVQSLFNCDLEESSSDSDFRIEDHDQSDFSNGDSKSSDAEESSEEEDSDSDDSSEVAIKSNNNIENGTMTFVELLQATTVDVLDKNTAKLLATPVCCCCLGDRSDDTNEIVECDGCGVTVHEGCYGVSDSVSISSTVSSCSTEPWFCEACKANVKDPDCELCPNRGGIFKETDVGKWVHLVCALYVPGVAFGEVDQLSMVTLFEMQYSKWGGKLCSLCIDERFARTGVCIGCDAGMCKTYFHVTCAQKAGLLSEAHHEEVDQADPFYAHCKLHSDKTLIKHRKRNYNAIILQVTKREQDLVLKKHEKPSLEQERIERKLKKHRIKYVVNKQTRTEPWVPTQKMPRLLNTSASACKKLMQKAELMGIDAVALEFQETQVASLADIRKKWHIPPAFSVEFIGYYLDRSIRLNEMKDNLQKQLSANKILVGQQQTLRDKYEDAVKASQEVQEKNARLKQEIELLHSSISALCPDKHLLTVDQICRVGKSAPNQQIVTVPVPSSSPVLPRASTPTLSSTPPPQMLASRTMSVPTAAALKMGVGFPLNNLMHGGRDDTGRILSTQCPNNEELMNECGICKRCTDQHLLAKCDTCRLYYHLGCLSPPLTRHPKKSKQYGWQCSECDKSDDSGPEGMMIPKAPRRSRIRYSKDGSILGSNPLISELGLDAFELVDHFDRIDKEEKLEKIEKIEKVIEKLDKVDKVLKLEKLEKPENFEKPEIAEKLEKVAKVEEPITLNNISAAEKVKMRHKKQLDKVPAAQPEKVFKKKSAENSLVPKNTNAYSTESKTEPKKRGRKRKLKTPNDTQVPASNGIDLTHVLPNSLNELNAVMKKLNQKPSLAEFVPVIPETITISNSIIPAISIQNSLESPTSPSKVKPNKKAKKEKRSIFQISSQLLQTQMQHQLEIAPLLAPKESTPPPAPNEFPKMFSPEPLSASQIITLNGITANGDSTLVCSTSGSHHKHKKRKDKHHKSSRHSHSPNSSDRQSSKEHKKKRKRKNHEMENPNDTGDLPIPRIKIKFKAIPLPAGSNKTPQFTYIVPSDNDPPEPPTRVMEIYRDFQSESTVVPNIKENGFEKKQHKPPKKKLISGPISRRRLSINLTPIKHLLAMSAASTASASSTPTPSVSNKSQLETFNCCSCKGEDTNQNLVKCDECQKHYHFHCLEPPLKKTPKRRGYSWHCADCDPTDIENN